MTFLLSAREWLATQLFRGLLRTLVALRIFRVTVHDRGRVPKGVPVIVVANHTSLLDGFYLWGALRRRAVALAMAETWDMPIIGPLVRWARFVPVDRTDKASGTEALAEMERRLDAGRVTIVFPEGKCAPPGETIPFKPGAAVLAQRTGAIIVPVGLHNTNAVMPLRAHANGKRFDRSQRVTVRFGEPIDPTDYDDADVLTAELERQVRALTRAS